jgi:hypothetical protein
VELIHPRRAAQLIMVRRASLCVNSGFLAYAHRVSDSAAPLPAAGPLPGDRLSILSHSAGEREHVTFVERQLEALSVDVYLAEHDPQPGTSMGRIEGTLRALIGLGLLFSLLIVAMAFSVEGDGS